MEIKRHCKSSRFEPRKLILVVAVMTTVGVVLQSSTIPYPLTIWPVSPTEMVPSYKTLNHTIQVGKSLPQATFEQFPPVLIAPVVGKSDWVKSDSDSQGESTAVTVTVLDVARLDGTTDQIKSNSDRLGESIPSSLPVSDVERVRVSLKGKGSNFNSNSAPEILNKNVRTKETSITSKNSPVPSRTDSVSSRRIRPSPSETAIWSLPPDQALLYAKKEIKNAPLVTDDPNLYPPIFRNVSLFKRSYELMERILKVYIYRDGERPICHKPFLRGIYASEGWFMKLMEENRQFVVRDPNKAHLFYLPYSSRQLELALYVPDSHNMRPLALYLKNYVNMISAKYPFWNRTRGSDHFLVACHDWGPYTTKEHEELCHNTIKALCNADVSEGFFVPGKDVSLPETTIRNPRKPLRGLGGKPVSQRSILAFFAGNMHGPVRPTLLKHWGDKDEDMKIYGPLSNRVSRNMSYIQHMKSSKFCICPMGYEVNSPRIVEAIYYECVPVIIADNLVPPFNDVLDWSAFSVTVAEKDIPKLKEILLAIPRKQYISMQTSVKRLQKHFLWHNKPIKYDIFHMILHSIWFNSLNQIQFEQ